MMDSQTQTTCNQLPSHQQQFLDFYETVLNASQVVNSGRAQGQGNARMTMHGGSQSEAGTGTGMGPGPDGDRDFCRFLYHKIQKVAEGHEKEEMLMEIQQLVERTGRRQHGQPAAEDAQDDDGQLLQNHASQLICHQQQDLQPAESP